MCDYSLHTVASRPAKAGDLLVTTSFKGTTSRGFCASDERNVAVCLMPGTELAFEKEPMHNNIFAPLLLWLGIGHIGTTLARFRKVDASYERAHHDALEFSNGRIVLVTSLREGQKVTVLQLPITSDMQPAKYAPAPAALTDRADA
jgi:hypothetical protein